VRQEGYVPRRNWLLGLRAVDKRSQLFEGERLVDEVALDRYTFVRDAYLQRRLNQVYDGDPPEVSAISRVPSLAEQIWRKPKAVETTTAESPNGLNTTIGSELVSSVGVMLEKPSEKSEKENTVDK
jgi:MlaA lipoprotein